MGIEDDIRGKLAPLANYSSGTSEAAKRMQDSLKTLAAHVQKLERRIEKLEREAKKR